MLNQSKKQDLDPTERLSSFVRRVRRDQQALRERVSGSDDRWYERPAADFASWNSLSDLLSHDRI
jgi:hypothetical protein